MRLFLLAAFVLALTTHRASADPIAHYNPATGGLTFRSVSDVDFVEIISLDSPIIKANALGKVDLPRNAATPQVLSWFDNGNPLGADFFAGDIIQPGTPGNRVGFLWLPGGMRFAIPGTLVEVPEPSTFALTGVALFALAALRRRK